MTDFPIEDSKTNGRWTKAQHEKFLLGLQLYGKEWKKIEALVGTRSGAQIRSHAQKFFIKTKKECNAGETAEEASENTSPVTQIPSQNYSYFLSKIVGRYSNEENFDFWSNLIDHKINCISPRPIRKSSFITCFSDSNEEERQPCKRIKVDDLLCPTEHN